MVSGMSSSSRPVTAVTAVLTPPLMRGAMRRARAFLGEALSKRAQQGGTLELKAGHVYLLDARTKLRYIKSTGTSSLRLHSLGDIIRHSNVMDFVLSRPGTDRESFHAAELVNRSLSSSLPSVPASLLLAFGICELQWSPTNLE